MEYIAQKDLHNEKSVFEIIVDELLPQSTILIIKMTQSLFQAVHIHIDQLFSEEVYQYFQSHGAVLLYQQLQLPISRFVRCNIGCIKKRTSRISYQLRSRSLYSVQLQKHYLEAQDVKI